METSTSTSLTARSINKYSLIAAGAGLIPIPVIDLAAVSGVQFDMIRQLCIQYGVGFDPRRGKAWITSL
ncbi:MAG: GTPase, partial [Bacteroidota bacterium]